MKLKDIEERLLHIEDRTDVFLNELRQDERKGVQKLLQQWERRLEKKEQAEKQFYQMTAFERKVHEQGFQFIAGIDEVGRGPLAGPVIACAVILPKDFKLHGLTDSKKLTEAKREEYFDYINENALAVSYGIISAEEIDKLNILEATKKAMVTAIQNLSIKPDYLLIDAVKLATPYPSESIIQGDAKSISIAAASVMAKVTRDRMMKKLHEDYPEYFFHKNMGYGTKDHLEAIRQYGITPYHRKSFEPIKSMTK